MANSQGSLIICCRTEISVLNTYLYMFFFIVRSVMNSIRIHKVPC